MKTSAVFPDLRGASVLITGGGSGIGAALTEGFARAGRDASPSSTSPRRRARAAPTASQKATGMRPLFLKADLRDIEALRAAVAQAERRRMATSPC